MEPGLFVVTGASSGIGQAIAWELSGLKHHIIACGRNENKMAETLNKNKEITPFLGDISDPKVASALLDFVKSKNIPLRGLVNNAGIFKPGSFCDSTDEDWEDQFQTNLMSAVRITRMLFPLLKQAAPSSVLNISSTLGIRPVAGTAAYSATKAAMVNWTKCLALEWAEFQIRVNCICPGLVDTPIHSFFAQEDTTVSRKKAHEMQPLKRMGKPREIASAAHFLLSEESAWTTGAILSVDGGIGL